MERAQFYVALVDYFETCVLGHMESDIVKAVLGGCLAVSPKLLDAWVENHSMALTALGLLEADGSVSTDGVRAWLDGAFRTQPSVTVKLDELVRAILPTMPEVVLNSLKTTVKFTKADENELLTRLGIPVQPAV